LKKLKFYRNPSILDGRRPHCKIFRGGDGTVCREKSGQRGAKKLKKLKFYRNPSILGGRRPHCKIFRGGDGTVCREKSGQRGAKNLKKLNSIEILRF